MRILSYFPSFSSITFISSASKPRRPPIPTPQIPSRHQAYIQARMLAIPYPYTHQPFAFFQIAYTLLYFLRVFPHHNHKPKPNKHNNKKNSPPIPSYPATAHSIPLSSLLTPIPTFAAANKPKITRTGTEACRKAFCSIGMYAVLTYERPRPVTAIPSMAEDGFSCCCFCCCACAGDLSSSVSPKASRPRAWSVMNHGRWIGGRKADMVVGCCTAVWLITYGLGIRMLDLSMSCCGRCWEVVSDMVGAGSRT